MAGTTPPPVGPPGPPGPPQQPDYLGGPAAPPPPYGPAGPGYGPGGYGPGGPGGPGYGPGGAQPPYPGSQPSRRGVKVLVLTMVLTLLVGGGAFAFYAADPFHLFRAGPQAAEAIPGDALFYAGMDLDPTAAQKIDALRFLNHFPAFGDATDLTDPNADVRRALIEKLIDSADCKDLDYDSDIKPWIGSRFGVAVMPPTPTNEQPFALAVQVSDEDAARKAVAVLNACDTADGPDPGVAFTDGFMLISDSQRDADAYAKSAGEHSLADDSDFKADMDSLGDLGVVSMWADVNGLLTGFADSIPESGSLTSLTSTIRVAATFRFGSDHVEVATAIYGDVQPGDHAPNPIVKLPGSTAFALSESPGEQQIAETWKNIVAQARSESLDIDAQIREFEAQTGFSLPGDLETLFGHNLMFALDSDGLTSANLSGDDVSSLNLGARFTNDPAKLNAIYHKLTKLIDSSMGGEIPFTKKNFPDGIVIASNDAYADKLGALDGDLGGSDAFTSVIDDGANKQFVLFFNFDAVKDQVLESIGDDAPQELIDNLRPLKAFGMTAEVDGNYTQLTMRMSVDD